MVVALLAVLVAAAVVHAQDAGIEGTVTDGAGLVLPGVTVEADRADAEAPAAVAVTGGDGAFALSGLAPGLYDVTFTLPGFQAEARGGVAVGAGPEPVGEAEGRLPAEVRRGVAVAAGATVTLDAVLSVQLEEQVVVVGSRARPRSVTESPVPIDAIPFRDVASQGAAPLDYRLRTLVPSFNVATHPISGVASLVRPASLRNLAHDHTLVLVNGKRRHRSAILVGFGGVTDGTQGPDLSPIPSIALRQVEVLRDGASAQYGSDASAGVMNFPGTPAPATAPTRPTSSCTTPSTPRSAPRRRATSTPASTGRPRSWVDHLDARSARQAEAPVLSGRFILDLEAAVALTPAATLSVGGQNVLDTYSDRMDLFATRFGLPYGQFTPWGFSGG